MKLALPLAFSALLLGAAAPSDPTLTAMSEELDRSMRELKLPERPPPYYIAYWVVDYQQHDAQAMLGALVSSLRDDGRRVRVETRVGSPALDNSNFMGGSGSLASFFDAALRDVPRPAPVRDGLALRRMLWLSTDVAYKSAVESLEAKLAARLTEVESEDADVPDFAPEEKTVLSIDERPAVGANEPHEAFVKEVSAVFRNHPEVQGSEAHLVVSTETRRLVTSEGTVAVVPTPYTELAIDAHAQADDGMILSRSATLANLTTTAPPLEASKELAARVAGELEALKKAPLIADYSGPVLFEGHAAAQIAHELLAESLSGTPAPKGAEGFESPLARKLGKRILPTDFSVVDDPTLETYRGIPLLGHYAIDDEGVPPEKVTLVEQGRLRAFVMSRTPSKEMKESNGHGRSGLVGWARGRIGNLILSSQNGLGAAALRARLLRVVREEGLEYGLIIRELEYRASASNGQVIPDPELVYKLTPDGKEELVRGATFGTLSVRDLRDIVASGRDASAHSFAMPTAGGFAVPTTVIAPSLLFEDVEVKRRTEPNKRPPLVPRPPIASSTR